MKERGEHDLVSVILTGGQATRMRPLSADHSKAMLPFLGRPLLAYLLSDLASAGFTRALLTNRGRGNDIQLHFGDGADIGVHLDYLAPGQWMGTAGMVMSLLENSPAAVSSPFLVIYGDSLLRIDYGSLIAFHRQSGASLTIACHRPRFDEFLFDNPAPDQPRTNFGVADLQPNGRVTHFEEKPYLERIGTAFVHPVANAAVYVIEPSALRGMPAPAHKELDFGYDLIPWLIARGDRIYGMDIAPGFRIDLGTLPHYLSVQLAALWGEVAIQPAFRSIDDGVWLQDGATIHPGATMIPPVFIGAGGIVENGATLAAAIIGARTTVRESALVRESMVLEDTTIGIGARVEGSILGSHNCVAAGAVVPRGTVTGAWSRIGGPELMLSKPTLGGLLGGGE